ncbi:MAG: methylenetetrahydrofolate reductase [Candidatus Eisenbacteria bacterium]|nr:methylenetetrahydrofolate reductase [Candidatus Eisenbacteria bacterium]
MKIVERIEQFQQQGQPFYSFEFFPPKTEAGLYNLYSRIDRLACLEPAFMDVTWGAGGTTAERTLEISANAQRYLGLDVLMHLTLTGASREQLVEVLEKAKQAGIHNVLALRGDLPRGKKIWTGAENGFRYASDLVRFVRQEHGDHFGIVVGGYPEGHVEAESKDECIRYMKEKLEAGADFVITQLFYDIDEYFDFMDRCRKAGVTQPIIPGVMPIHNYERFERICRLGQVKVPARILEDLEPIKSDDKKVAAYGVELAADMCRRLLEHGAPGLHFYTLNLESSVSKILDRLGIVGDVRPMRSLPWRRSAMGTRNGEEDVRPIYWSNRPGSYLARTMDWDDFPNGRWGDSRSPSFGDLNDYYLFRRGKGVEAVARRARQMWGEPRSEEDIREVFIRYCRSEIDRLPWCDLPLQVESRRILEQLIRLNERGYLTINSQPPVNGAPSTDPEVGWGGEDGRVYQKAYVEFFASRERTEALLRELQKFPALTYHAVNVRGESLTNAGGVQAITWGVFPDREIVQPTVVDPESFHAWKDEAFQLWRDEWRDLYDEGSPAYKLIEDIHDTYYLVNIVDNDYIEGDLFAPFRLEEEGAGQIRSAGPARRSKKPALRSR